MIRFKAGLTLLECLVVIVVMAILSVLATPSFREMLVRRSVLVAAEALVDDLRYARSESLKRGSRVTVCSSADGNACNPTASWVDGWIVFVDRGSKGVVDSGDEVLRIQPQPPGVASIASDNVNPGNDRAVFVFQPLGMGSPATQTFRLTPGAPVPANSVRVVCVSSQGRPRLAAVGAIACS
jgi:type IV fimbrial biogenesis protein FimT